jgi:hypothetical protein
MAEVNELESEVRILLINKTESCSFEKISKINETLAKSNK